MAPQNSVACEDSWVVEMREQGWEATCDKLKAQDGKNDKQTRPRQEGAARKVVGLMRNRGSCTLLCGRLTLSGPSRTLLTMSAVVQSVARLAVHPSNQMLQRSGSPPADECAPGWPQPCCEWRRQVAATSSSNEQQRQQQAAAAAAVAGVEAGGRAAAGTGAGAAAEGAEEARAGAEAAAPVAAASK